MKPPTHAPMYMLIYGRMTEIAREHGYALAVHGTLQRDMDVVLVPWTEAAAPPEDVVAAIAEQLAWARRGDEDHQLPPAVDGPEEKPHGRQAWYVPFFAGQGIDISVMPRAAS